MVDDTTPMDAAGASRCVLAVRQMLREVISPELMLNPAVDILLALYVAPDTSLAWQDVCATTVTSEETCRRWGSALQERKLVTLDDHGCALTDEGRRLMANVNSRVWHLAANHLSDDLRSSSPAGDRDQGG